MEATEPRKSPLYDVLLPRLEVLCVLLGLLGGIMFWNHWVQDETLFIIGLGGLAEVYLLKALEPQGVADEVNFPQQYFSNSENQFPANKNLSFFLDTLAPKVMYISSACVLVGVLFKLMFWDGGNTMLMASVPLLAFFILAWALNQRVNRRAVFVAVIGVSMLCISYESLMRQLYRDDPVLIEAIVNQIHHPHDPAALQAYQQRMREYRHNH